MSILFISDLHLSPDQPGITACFFRFLEREAPNAEALYILGDLFEAWIGDDVSDDFVNSVVEALKKWPKALFIMQGNRDFLMGQKFAERIGATLLPDPTKIDLYGVPTLLTHGDLLCTDDIPYQKWRKIVHMKWLQKLFLLLPVSWRQKIARLARSKSTGHTKIVDVTPKAVEEWLSRYKVPQIIHGHTHNPAIHVNRAVLPAWHEDNGGALVASAQAPLQLTFFD